jgi:hypothetical protein
LFLVVQNFHKSKNTIRKQDKSYAVGCFYIPSVCGGHIYLLHTLWGIVYSHDAGISSVVLMVRLWKTLSDRTRADTRVFI